MGHITLVELGLANLVQLLVRSRIEEPSYKREVKLGIYSAVRSTVELQQKSGFAAKLVKQNFTDTTLGS